ncbi:hypothetical protein BGW38_003931, partial [Lunasporangiospora selenospora]
MRDNPLPQPPAHEVHGGTLFTSPENDGTARPARVGSLLLQSIQVTVPTFSDELDLGSIANPNKYSVVKQYSFGLLLFKPLLAFFFDCFSIAYLAAWVRDSGAAALLGEGKVKANVGPLVVYTIAAVSSLLIVAFGTWNAFGALRRRHIQDIFVTREAYRWVCLTSRDRFLFFERVGQGHGNKDALMFFAWFTLRDWMQHALCDLPRLVINCFLLGQVAYNKSVLSRGETPSMVMPELSGWTHFVIVVNIMLQICNFTQFLSALAVMVLARRQKLVSLRRDEHLHSYCQRNLNVRIVRMYKVAKQSGTTAPLREHNRLEQQLEQYQAEEATGRVPGVNDNGIDLSLAALAWDTETQDDHVDYNHYAYRPRPISLDPPARPSAAVQQSSHRLSVDSGPFGGGGRR